jgi:hypothetical protein
LLAKVQTIIEKISMLDIFLPQNTKLISLLGRNRVKRWGVGITYCINLTSVIIPEGVNSINDHAFYNCNLISVTSLIQEPFIISEQVFSDFFIATLYVPHGTKAKYEATWYEQE